MYSRPATIKQRSRFAIMKKNGTWASIDVSQNTYQTLNSLYKKNLEKINNSIFTLSLVFDWCYTIVYVYIIIN